MESNRIDIFFNKKIITGGDLSHFLLLFLLFAFSFSSFAQQSFPPCSGGGDDNGTIGGGGKSTNIPGGGTQINILTLHATDPNEIQGPTGITSKKWMTAKDNFAYTVRFENDPEFSTGPAQKVLVSVPVDSNFNMNSVRLGNFGFGNLFFPVPPNSPTYYHRLDLRDSLGLYVDVLAGIDIPGKQILWVFESIDPATGAEPLDAALGFLPVRDTSINRFNDSIPNKGEGFVSYTIQPSSTAHTGDSVKAYAGIIFDLNAPVITNTEFNIIDAVAPSSQVSVLPLSSADTIKLAWSGQDDVNGSLIQNYDLYVSENGGAFTLYKSAISDTATTFIGSPGNTYYFFSVAKDTAGNIEAFKSNADGSIILNPPSINICSGQTTTIAFNSLGSGYTYQWQVDNGTGFVNITTGSLYSNTTTKALSLNHPPTSLYGYVFRCVATKGADIVTSPSWSVKFSNTWTGNINTDWGNPGNWTCNSVPDEYVDVIVKPTTNSPQINSQAACRSLNLFNGVLCTVNAGFHLDIKGR